MIIIQKLKLATQILESVFGFRMEYRSAKLVKLTTDGSKE